MSDRRLAFLYTPEIEGLTYPPDCPFKTQRAGLTRSRLAAFGLLGGAGRAEVAPRQASLEDLAVFHTSPYLEQLQRAAQGDLTVDGLHMGLGGPDTPVFRTMFEYSAWACGASLDAADLLLRGDADVTFNFLGGFHHAMADRASGFCYLNDGVLACQRLATAGRRVAYIDIDAHHGDGVQAAFYRRADVLTVSVHESGRTLFPWGGFETEVGEGAGLGHNLNLSLPAGIYDEAFLSAFQRAVMPVVRAYGPDVLVVELGMDALAGDPLTHLTLTNNAPVDALQQLLALDRPTLVLGGGGYHVENTVRGWALAWRVAGGDEDEHDWSLGMGGVMLGSSEWAGGLRDRVLPVEPGRRERVDAELGAAVQAVITHVFPHHGLGGANAPAAPPAPPAEASNSDAPASSTGA